MGREKEYHGEGGQDTMGRRFNIPDGGDQNTMGRGSDIAWIRGWRFHG